ncbi:cellulose binding domain-containing protein [Microbispora sp. H13382]|uniref:cellulose binding domain-containing protein n=1 Tax=Microbispora sp. H13382 TaxID=2729112 RepID=UPI0016044FCC|nr:cellulose binding domain-containing protein [Microbispora sp. H13382]
MSRRKPMLTAIAVAALAAVLATVGPALSAGAARTPARTVSAAAATAGCGKAPGLASGTHTIQSSGKNRSYILRVPDGYDRNRPYRLVFGFHWLGGTATDVATGQTVQRDVWAYYGLLRLANNSTIFVAPQGLNNGWANSNGEDLTFVDDMIRQIEGALCVDTEQLFATGFSYGGAMSYAIACARATVFRAVAVQSGGVLSGCSGGSQPIAYMGIHGIRDSVLGVSGGRSLRDRFVRNNGCTTQNPPEPAQGSLTHRITAYSGCSAGHPVVWAAFDEGHIAAPQDGAPGDSGSRTWVPAEVWKFFTQFQSTASPSPSPSSSPSPSPSPSGSPSSSPVPGACSATIATTNSWPGGFQSTVTVRAGSTPVNGWTVKWTWPSGQTISSVWNGTQSGSGSSVTVRNESYNGSIAAGSSTTFGFTANGSAATPSATCTSP